MKELLDSIYSRLIPESFASIKEQKEYVVTAALISAAIPLAAVLIIFFILTVINVDNNTDWQKYYVISGIVFLGLILVWIKQHTAARYFVVWSLLGYSLWGTINSGLNSISTLGYVISMLLAYLIIDRRFILVTVIIIVPPLLSIVYPPSSGTNSNSLWAYFAMMTMIAFLLTLLSQLREKVSQNLRQVSELEAVQQAGFSVLSSLDLRETIAKILEELKNIIPHDSASVLLMRDNSYLELVGGSGWDAPEGVLGIRFPVPGDNPNTIVIKEGRPHVLGNAPEEFPTFKEKPHNHILSWLGVPLIENGKIIGMMAIDSKSPNHFSEEHVSVTMAFADHVATAIQNAELFEIVNKAVFRRSILYKASQNVIRAGADLEQIYTSIHEAACQLMACEAFVITLLDETEQYIEGAYLIDKGGRSENIMIPLGEGMSGKVIETGEAVLVDDLLAESEFQGEHFGHEDDVRSLVAVPFSIGEKVIGILSAQSYKPGAFGSEELELLELLAAQAGIAIENARLIAKMAHMASTDSLTGLHNRRAFDEILIEEFKRAKRYDNPLSLVIMDIDDFKKFNDRYGHSRGDQHLQEISKLTLSCIREQDIELEVKSFV